MEGALKGLKIISFAQIAQGPHATQLLGDMGAEVIKVERRGSGEWMRQWSQNNCFLDGESTSFLSLNRNKKSFTLDLKKQKGKEIARQLVKEGDVVVENFRPGVMERLGLGYQDLSEINPSIIYCSSSGYGTEGPYRDRPGQDLLAQAMSGLMSITGNKEGLPMPAGVAISDWMASGLMVAGILAALHHREKTGEGQKVEVNLLDALLDMQAQEAVTYLNSGATPQRGERNIGHVYHEAPYGVYETKDGYIALSLSPLKDLGELLELPELGEKYSTTEDAIKNRDEIARQINGQLSDKPTSHWVNLFLDKDLWCAPVQDYDEVFNDPQVKANEMVVDIDHPVIGEFKATGVPINMNKSDCTVEKPPPMLGEHNEEVLQELGYSAEEIDILREKEII